MAFFNDLKKLLFGAKSVGKSAAETVAEAGKEAGKNLAQESSEMLEKAKQQAEVIGKVVQDKAGQLIDKAADLAEDVGEKVLQTAEVAKAKAKDFADNLSGDAEEKAQSNSTSAPTEKSPEEKAAAAVPETDTLELKEIPGSMEREADSEPANKQEEKTAAAVPETDPLALVKDTGRKVMDAGSDLADKLEEKAEKIGGALLAHSDKAMDKAAELTENLGKKVLETGGKLADKFGETAEDVGEKLFEKGGEALEKAKDFVADVGSKVLKAKDDLAAKAEEEAAKTGKTADSLIDKMKDLNQKLEDKISGNNAQFADKPLDTGGSEFKKHDSFWDKAKKFAEGDYHGKGNQPKSGEMNIQDNPDYKAPEKTGKVKGFDDRDNDGDELIDDAIIEE